MDGVNERVHPDFGEHSGALRGDLAEQHAENALREIVSFDFARERHAAQLGREVPVTTDDALQKAGVSKMVQATFRAVALASAVEQREVARRTALQKSPLQRRREHLRVPRADEAPDRDRRAGGNRRDGLSGGDDAGRSSHGREEEFFGHRWNTDETQMGRGYRSESCLGRTALSVFNLCSICG